MFNNTNFQEINYLNFDANFEIRLADRIKIIFGPNGTGKTSIYKNIKKNNVNYSYIDYEGVEQSVISKKDTIEIGASILLIESKIREKESLLNEIAVKDNLKALGITSKATAESISHNLEILRKSPENAIAGFNLEKIDIITSLPNNQIMYFNANAKAFLELQELDTQVNDLKQTQKKYILKTVSEYLDDQDMTCPICGASYHEPIKAIIARKISEIIEIQNVLVANYQKAHPDFTPERILLDINNIKNTIMDNNITVNNVENYFICGGSLEKANLISDSILRLNQLNAEIIALESERDIFYNNLKSARDSIISIFKIQLSVNETNITFNDISKSLIIKLPRKVDEYSTGEINMITFATCMLEFVSSNRDTIVIDDPLSSYDIPNQYKIVYEIASVIGNNKKVLIFTHNVDMVNIANTQHNLIFEYAIIEKRNNTLYLNDINFNVSDNILSLDTLLAKININYQYINYLKLLNNKETWLPTADEHLIFHYDCQFSKNIDGVYYTNDYFVDLINNFSDNTFQNLSYLENTADKIIYTCALRIWIEKQFFTELNNDNSLHGKTYGEKVKYVFDGNRWTGSPRVTKKYLLSKKVMLNQNIHQKSQIQPFYFALNLTLDDVSKEIEDIKSHFAQI